MSCFLLIFLLSLLGFTGSSASQENMKVIDLYDSTPLLLHSMNSVLVSDSDLTMVSSSVLVAENWVRSHVLAHFPATKITTIVVENTVLCFQKQETKMDLVLPSLKNIYYSLTRWGLEREIKVSALFSSNCLSPPHTALSEVLDFLHSTNSTYTINPPPNFTFSSQENFKLVTSHLESMKKIGFLNINVMILSPRNPKPTSRKLSFIDSTMLHTSIGYSIPSNIAKHPTPPIPEFAPPPSLSFSFSPELSPAIVPASPPFGPTLPPCNPVNIGAAAPAPVPEVGEFKGLWCVAKPSVPADTLQEAMDYACGEGGADCEEIMPHGNCYNPDTIVAHASYAFNSYWQKNKKLGGTCSFGGTAMIINADPSFLHCQFILS